MATTKRQMYEQMAAQGIVPSLQQSVAQSTLEALPGQAGSIAARQAELAALQQAAPQAVTARTRELLKPALREKARSLAKMYAEPLVWTVAGQQVGSALDLSPTQQALLAGAAGVVGGRTRAGKAIATRWNAPGVQAARGRALLGAGRRLEDPTAAMRLAIAMGVPPAVAAQMVTQEER